jgi:hypothetical protein
MQILQYLSPENIPRLINHPHDRQLEGSERDRAFFLNEVSFISTTHSNPVVES